MGNPRDPRFGYGGQRPVPTNPQAGRGAPARRVPVPPPAQPPRPAPARGSTGVYSIRAGARPGIRAAPARPPYPVRPVRYQPVPPVRYQAVPARHQVGAPPRAVPAAQWQMATPMPYRTPISGPYSPPYGYPGWNPRQPPSRNGNAAVIALVLLIVALLTLLLGLSVVYVSGTTDTGAGRTTEVFGPTGLTSTTSETVTTTTTTAATTTTSAFGTTSSATTPTGTAALQGNPLYANPTSGLIRQACNAVGWPADSASGKRFFDSVTPCLDRAWGTALNAAGLEYREPTVVVPAGTRISNPCGSVDLASENVAAFYCPANETLYMPPQGLQVSRYGNQPAIYLAVFAHEYGHHVQMVSGILSAGNRLERQYGRQSERGLEASRRSELQAQCFSGLFFRSVSDTGGQFTRADYPTVLDDQERGDPPGSLRTHGTFQHSQGWWNTGYQRGQLAPCNTWAASSSDVA